MNAKEKNMLDIASCFTCKDMVKTTEFDYSNFHTVYQSPFTHILIGDIDGVTKIVIKSDDEGYIIRFYTETFCTYVRPKNGLGRLR